MSEQPVTDEDVDAERRFNETLERLASMPPKPHKPKREPGEPSSRKASEQK